MTEERADYLSAGKSGTGRDGSADRADGEFLKSFQDVLPITLISTPRWAITTCSEGDRVEDVIRETREADYDYVPVTRREDQYETVGVLKTKPDRTGTVKDELEPLSEPLLIGGDASILDFARQADTQPYRLVVSGTRIDGLVTVSDLQKLPARAALFGLMTDLEILLQETIKRAFHPPQWQQILNETRRQNLRRRITEATKGGVLINDEVLYTELCDKLDIVKKLPDVMLSLNQKKRLVTLRDQLAHANEFAASEESALRACETVRDALELRQSLGRR